MCTLHFRDHQLLMIKRGIERALSSIVNNICPDTFRSQIKLIFRFYDHRLNPKTEGLLV